MYGHTAKSSPWHRWHATLERPQTRTTGTTPSWVEGERPRVHGMAAVGENIVTFVSYVVFFVFSLLGALAMTILALLVVPFVVFGSLAIVGLFLQVCRLGLHGIGLL